MQNKYIAFIVAHVVYVNCMHAKGWENEKGKIMCVGLDCDVFKEQQCVYYLKWFHENECWLVKYMFNM